MITAAEELQMYENIRARLASRGGRDMILSFPCLSEHTDGRGGLPGDIDLHRFPPLSVSNLSGAGARTPRDQHRGSPRATWDGES